MKKNILMVGVAAMVGLATFALLPAQEQFQPTPQIFVKEGQLKGGGGRAGIVLQELVNGKTVTGAPYSAEAVTETTQTLGDGNRIERSSSVKLYRDGQGRERQEEGAPDSRRIFVSDPVLKTSFTLDPQAHTAQKSATLRLRSTNGADPARVLELALGDLAAAQAGRGRGPLNISIDGTGGISYRTAGSSEPLIEPEQLSPKTIEGVFATGTRRTVTIPAGQIGNQLPIQVVDETWYSPDLQMNIMTKHSDPRTGEVVYQLKNISRGEPDATLFQVPPDYKITETGVGRRGGARGGNVTP